MLILAILGCGVLVGGLAQFILGRDGGRVDWTIGLVAGLGGTFVGGLLFSLISSDGLALKPSGLIGSVIVAVIITAVWRWYASKQQTEATAAATGAARSGRHH